MKKVFVVLLSVMILVGMVPAFTLAATVVDSGTCGADGDNLTWTLDSAGLLTISGAGAMKDYSDSSNIPWYSYRSQIKSAVIENGVTSIGNEAFEDCNSLTSVMISDSVTIIGDSAFSACINLVNVTIPDSVISIGDWAFCNCYKLTSVTIGNRVRSIGFAAFGECSSMTSVTIPDSVTSIGERAFLGCSSLTSVTIPDSVMSIGEWTFCNCKNLTSVKIGNSVTSIGVYAFLYCNSLKNVTIPDSVTSIGDISFYECESLKYIFYGGSETQWQAISIGDENEELTSAILHYNATDHTPDTPIETVHIPATCSNAGEKLVTIACAVCGKALNERTVTLAKTAHTDADEDGVCDDCKQPMPGSGASDGQAEDVCKWCNKVHDNTFIGRLTKIFHNIAYFFAHLFGRR